MNTSKALRDLWLRLFSADITVHALNWRVSQTYSFREVTHPCGKKQNKTKKSRHTSGATLGKISHRTPTPETSEQATETEALNAGFGSPQKRLRRLEADFQHETAVVQGQRANTLRCHFCLAHPPASNLANQAGNRKPLKTLQNWGVC